MFGRRKSPVGDTPATPPPGGKEPFPIEKMDRALDGAIRLLTRALDEAGEDSGKLAIRGAVPGGVTSALSNCTTYRGEDDGSPTYLALGVTHDFEAFSYQPHCLLFMIINATLLAEDPIPGDLRNSLALSQFKGPLIDAHLMRRWISYILPVPDAMRGEPEALKDLAHQMMGELKAVLGDVPPAWATRIDLGEKFKAWGSGFPGTIGRKLTPDVPRMNGLPMTPFIEQTLTNFLADLQMRGLRDR